VVAVVIEQRAGVLIVAIDAQESLHEPLAGTEAEDLQAVKA